MTKEEKSGGIVDLGFRTLLVVVLLIIIFYFLKPTNSDTKTRNVPTPLVSGSPTITREPTVVLNQFEWKTYESKEFGFSLRYPASLNINDIGNVGGYIDFIRFEEEPSLNLDDKGIAVGVSTLSLDKEIVKIKNQIKTDGGAILADESKMEFKGFPATRLYYKPEDPSQEEERIIVIVNSGAGFTYSISTVPSQMPKVVEGFNFIKN